MNKNAADNLGWIAVIALLIFGFVKLSAPTETPPAELTPAMAEPVAETYQGDCDGSPVTFYGKPTYHLDPEMQHMAGLECCVDRQCNVWPPLGAKEGQQFRCCLNKGECFEVK